MKKYRIYKDGLTGYYLIQVKQKDVFNTSNEVWQNILGYNIGFAHRTLENAVDAIARYKQAQSDYEKRQQQILLDTKYYDEYGNEIIQKENRLNELSDVKTNYQIIKEWFNKLSTMGIVDLFVLIFLTVSIVFIMALLLNFIL